MTRYTLDGAEVDPSAVDPSRLYDVVAETDDGRALRPFRYVSPPDEGDALVPSVDAAPPSAS